MNLIAQIKSPSYLFTLHRVEKNQLKVKFRARLDYIQSCERIVQNVRATYVMILGALTCSTLIQIFNFVFYFYSDTGHSHIDSGSMSMSGVKFSHDKYI